MTPKAGWYTDPSGRFPERWWDGNRWTATVTASGLRLGSDTPSEGWEPPEADAVEPKERTPAAALVDPFNWWHREPGIAPASWYPDPIGQHRMRYWDGTRWTDSVADDEPHAGTDPLPDQSPAPSPPEDPADVGAYPGEAPPQSRSSRRGCRIAVGVVLICLGLLVAGFMGIASSIGLARLIFFGSLSVGIWLIAPRGKAVQRLVSGLACALILIAGGLLSLLAPSSAEVTVIDPDPFAGVAGRYRTVDCGSVIDPQHQSRDDCRTEYQAHLLAAIVLLGSGVVWAGAVVATTRRPDQQ